MRVCFTTESVEHEKSEVLEVQCFLVATEFSPQEKAFLVSGTGLKVGCAAPYATRSEAERTV